MDSLFGISSIPQLTWDTIVFSMLLSFILSTIVAKTYEMTYEGLSWSKSIAQTLILGSLVTCLIMMAIGDNLARGIGIIGSLAIIRFRTNLRDPRDMIFIFAALGTGVAAGVQSYLVAVFGAIIFCAVAALLRIQDFGATRRHDGILRFQLPNQSVAYKQVMDVLHAETKQCILVAMRNIQQGDLVDYTYQIKLAKPELAEKLLDALEKTDKISGLKYMSQHSTVEV